MDFLIPPSLAGDRPGTLRNVESDFAAIIAPGLQLAFVDRERVRLAGKTIMGEIATRNVWVAGPGAYVVLKALAFKNRGENTNVDPRALRDAWQAWLPLKPSDLPALTRHL